MTRTSKNGPVPKHITAKVNKAMESRKERAAIKQDLKGQPSSDPSTETDEAIAKITAMLEASGTPFMNPERELKFASPEAANGVALGLRKLAYNPQGLRDDLTIQWAGRDLDANSVIKMLKTLAIPKWAKRMKTGAIESFSKPNVDGMLIDGKTPNKDLASFLRVERGLELSPPMRKIHDRVVDRVAAYYMSVIENDECDLYDVVTNSRGERKVRLRMWTLEEMTSELSKVINTSSPGYPFNGFDWEDEVEGYTCIEHTLRACERLMADDAVLDGFAFIQQSRATGDGGGAGKGNSRGRQRRVDAAPNIEKGIGHILARPFKTAIKGPKLSGQRGIQEVSREFKRACQDIINSEEGPDGFFCGDADVGFWDVAQLHYFMKISFFAICQIIFDDEDPFTTRLLAVYHTMYDRSYIVTAMGQICCESLPSGCSITTVSAHVNHTVIIEVINERSSYGGRPKLFHTYGLQGDDNVFILQDYQEERDDLMIKATYRAYGCEIKGQMHIDDLSDEDACAVFLNECIRVRDPIDEDRNVKFPRWNLFYAENYRDKSRGSNLDRMLLAEVKDRIAHPTSLELNFVSFVSKLDRMRNMPFYGHLIEWFMKQTSTPIHSWLGERVCPNSPTVQYLMEREASQGIEWPSPEKRAVERQEEFWATGDELEEMMVLIGLLTPVSMDARRVCKNMTARAQNHESWKRARKAIESVTEKSFDSLEEDISWDVAADIVKRAFAAKYRDPAYSKEEKRAIAAAISPTAEDVAREGGYSQPENEMKITSRSMARTLLALNEQNAFTLRKRMAEMVYVTRESTGWDQLPHDVQERSLLWLTTNYGVSEDKDWV